MLRLFVGTVLILVLVMCVASAEIVFLRNGECIEGRLNDKVPDSNKITVKTVYGEQEFYRRQVLTCVSDFNAKRAGHCLKSARYWLRRYNLNKATDEFETLLMIDEKFQFLIDIYMADYFARLAKLSVKRLAAPVPPVLPTFTDMILAMRLGPGGVKNTLNEITGMFKDYWANTHWGTSMFLMFGGAALLLFIGIFARSPKTNQGIERPFPIKLVCLFLAAVTIINTISRIKVWADLSSSTQTVYVFNTALILIVLYGLWKMRKWSVLLFGILAGFSQWLLLHYSIWTYSMLIVPAAILLICLSYFPKMEWSAAGGVDEDEDEYDTYYR
jgi:hypothetical protein